MSKQNLNTEINLEKQDKLPKKFVSYRQICEKIVVIKQHLIQKLTSQKKESLQSLINKANEILNSIQNNQNKDWFIQDEERFGWLHWATYDSRLVKRMLTSVEKVLSKEDFQQFINLQDKHGATALLYASRYNDKHIVITLLQNGADPGIRGNIEMIESQYDGASNEISKEITANGISPLEIAIMQCNYKIFYKIIDDYLDKDKDKDKLKEIINNKTVIEIIYSEKRRKEITGIPLKLACDKAHKLIAALKADKSNTKYKSLLQVQYPIELEKLKNIIQKLIDTELINSESVINISHDDIKWIRCFLHKKKDSKNLRVFQILINEVIVQRDNEKRDASSNCVISKQDNNKLIKQQKQKSIEIQKDNLPTIQIADVMKGGLKRKSKFPVNQQDKKLKFQLQNMSRYSTDSLTLHKGKRLSHMRHSDKKKCRDMWSKNYDKLCKDSCVKHIVKRNELSLEQQYLDAYVRLISLNNKNPMAAYYDMDHNIVVLTANHMPKQLDCVVLKLKNLVDRFLSAVIKQLDGSVEQLAIIVLEFIVDAILIVIKCIFTNQNPESTEENPNLLQYIYISGKTIDVKGLNKLISPQSVGIIETTVWSKMYLTTKMLKLIKKLKQENHTIIKVIEANAHHRFGLESVSLNQDLKVESLNLKKGLLISAISFKNYEKYHCNKPSYILIDSYKKDNMTKHAEINLMEVILCCKSIRSLENNLVIVANKKACLNCSIVTNVCNYKGAKHSVLITGTHKTQYPAIPPSFLLSKKIEQTKKMYKGFKLIFQKDNESGVYEFVDTIDLNTASNINKLKKLLQEKKLDRENIFISQDPVEIYEIQQKHNTEFKDLSYFDKRCGRSWHKFKDEPLDAYYSDGEYKNNNTPSLEKFFQQLMYSLETKNKNGQEHNLDAYYSDGEYNYNDTPSLEKIIQQFMYYLETKNKNGQEHNLDILGMLGMQKTWDHEMNANT